jgi:hypothetical protein
MKTPRSDASIQWENRGGGHVLRLWQKNVYCQNSPSEGKPREEAPSPRPTIPGR